MSASTTRPSRTLSRTFALVFVLTLALVVAGCGRNRGQEAVANLEGVSTTGDNPFTPAVGTDRADVAPPPNSGGTFRGDTVGLFGGSQSQTSCDKTKLVAFLQQDQAKAAAWAGVVGIKVDEIQAFVASLTPAILRSDTRVMNHGFKDGKATEVPAVLQAGTAVLVDVHGAPVTKCFCGNPLSAPAFTVVTFKGQRWSHFSENEVTVIAPVTQTVQQFVIVDPGTSRAFQRPAGSAGQQDSPATVPVPPSFAPPPSPLPPTISGPVPSGAPLPPGLAVPTTTLAPSPQPPLPTVTPSAASPTPGAATPTPTPTRQSPTPPPTTPAPTTPPPTTPAPTTPAPTTPPPTTQPRTTPAPTTPAPTTPTPTTPAPTTPAPTTPAPTTPAPTTPAPTTPAPTTQPSGTATPSGTPTLTPTPPSVVRASWVVGDCFVRGGQAHARVLVRPDGSSPHTFAVTVRLGVESNPIAVQTVRVAASPGQIGQADVNEPTSTPDGAVQCAILSVVDENGRPAVAGEPLPPPPDTNPMPAQPGPGVPSGPSVPATPPAPVIPGPS